MVSDYEATINFFLGKSDGTYTSVDFLNEKGDTFNPDENYQFGTHELIDWNSDGLWDIIYMTMDADWMSNRGIPLTLYLNIGTMETPVFSDGTPVLFGGKTALRENPDIEVADINLDGLDDIIIGSIDCVEYALNIGEVGAPVFTALKKVLHQNGTNLFSASEYFDQKEFKPTVGDVNGDGFPDIIAGVYTKSKFEAGDYLYQFNGIPDGSPLEFTLRVNNGSGSGRYAPNESFTVVAKDSTGYLFDHWIDETGTLDAASKKSTTGTMGTNNVTITAVYKKDGDTGIKGKKEISSDLILFSAHSSGFLCEVTHSGDYSFQIMNVRGQIAGRIQKRLTPGIHTIDLLQKDLSAGVYLINVERHGEAILSKSLFIN